MISAKAYIVGKYLFIPTGLTFGDCSSPPNFEPIARARMALSKELSRGYKPVPEFPEYLEAVKFAPPPPPGTRFTQARADRFNPGIPQPADGSLPPTEFNMHVDDALYAAAGKSRMLWAMRCSIGGLIGIMGENEPHLRASQPDMDKFLREVVSHVRHQLGYVTNTRTMIVSIPAEKRAKLLKELQDNWGPLSSRQSFTVSEAAELLGVLVSLCRVCSWGIFLFLNLYHAMSQILAKNAARIWHSPEFKQLIATRDIYSRHPTDSSKYRFFCKKVVRAVYDSKAKTYMTAAIRDEINFLIQVFSNPKVYRWKSPISHLIQR